MEKEIPFTWDFNANRCNTQFIFIFSNNVSNNSQNGNLSHSTSSYSFNNGFSTLKYWLYFNDPKHMACGLLAPTTSKDLLQE